MSPNAKQLRQLLKNDNAVRAALRAQVPLTSLARHAKGNEVPAARWVLFYDMSGLGLPWHGWYSAADWKRNKKAVTPVHEALAAAMGDP